jgi:hypothetical protein
VKEQEVKKSLGRPRSRRVDNIKMDLRDIGIGGMNRIDLVHDKMAPLDMVLNLMVPLKGWELTEKRYNWQPLNESSAP